MYSATSSPEVNELSHKILNNHSEIRVDKLNTTADSINHVIYPVEESRKIDLFKRLLNEQNWFQVLVFTSTKGQADELLGALKQNKIEAAVCHGDKSQGSRRRALADFKSAKLQVLIATEVAARGLDIQGLDIVVNYNLPYLPEDYVHRIGRTGRAGKKGTAVLVVPYQRRKRVESMLRGAKINADWMKVPSADEIKAKDHERLLEKLTAPVELDDADKALGKKLLETMSAEDIAAALVATHRAKMPAAEEMLDDGKRERAKESHRAGFDDAVWFRINVGRKNNADPKWLLPLLCRRGGVTKNDVGAIRIMGNESFVAIAAKASKDFGKAAQKPGHDEDADVEIKQADGPPRDAARANKKRGKQGYQGRGGKGGPHRGKRKDGGGEGRGDKRKDKPRGDFKKGGKKGFGNKGGKPKGKRAD